MSECLDKIQNYLMSGGLFNPELMEHEKVRDMVMDCKKEITRLKRALEIANEAIGKLSNSGDGSHKDKHASFYDCLPTLQIEFSERQELAKEAQKQIKDVMEGK